MNTNKYISNDKATKIRGNIAVFGIILLLFVYIGRIQELFPRIYGLSFGKITMGLALCLYLMAPQPKSKLKILSAPQVKYIVGILLLGVISIPFSVWPGRSFNFIVYEYSKLLIFFFLLVLSVNTSKDLKKINWGLIFSLVVMVVMAVKSEITPEMRGRLTVSLAYDANDIALVLTVSAPIVYFLMNQEKGIKKIGLFMLLASMLYIIIKTGSRGGFVGLIATALLILVKDKNTRAKKYIIFGILAVIFICFASPTYWERISTIFSESDYNVAGEGGRVDIWKKGVIMMLNKPFTGVGAGAFVTAEGLGLGGMARKWSAAHNSFIQMGGELGLGGLILFVALFISSLKSLKQMKLAAKDMDMEENLWLINALGVSFYSFMVTGFFLSQAYSSLLYFLIANCIILKKLAINRSMNRIHTG